MKKKRKSVIKSNEISKMYTFCLGGVRQKVLIEGKSKELPVVITLHGGPGTPIPFSAGCRGLFPDFTDKFLMVYWDQLGCGINNSMIDDTFQISSFVDMTADLIREIKSMFPDNRILLFATSWGSILSAKVLEKTEDMVDGVVVCGQIIKNVFFSQEVFDALEKSDLPEEKLKQIKNISVETFSTKDMQLTATAIRKFTGGYVNKKGEKAPIGGIIWGLLTSPDYKFQDFKAIVINGYQNNVSLWKEILQLDLQGTLQNVRIPYRILQGDTDIVASTWTVKEVVKTSANPYLQCQIVEHTGHIPGTEMMNQVLQTLVEEAGNQK